MSWHPRVSGRLLGHTESFAGGKARLSLLVPASARGKTLTVRLAIVVSGRSASRTLAYRVH